MTFHPYPKDQDLDAMIQHLEKGTNAQYAAVCKLKGIRNHVKSPIYKLPNEVLEIIFDILSDIDRGPLWPERPQVPPWVRVTYVCRRWRNTSIAYTNLWARIGDYPSNWISQFLRRSSSMPLDIRINLKLHPIKIPLVVLQDHIFRVRSLRLEGSHDKIMGAIILLTKPAPLLEVLELQRLGGERRIHLKNVFSGKIPRLRKLRLFTNIVFNSTSPFLSERLESLSLSSKKMAASNMRSILWKTPNLRVLEHQDFNFGDEMRVDEENAGHGQSRVTLPFLRSLSLDSGHPNLAGRILSNLHVPLLDSISICTLQPSQGTRLDELFFPSVGSVVRQTEAARGPFHSARLQVSEDQGELVASSIWGWRSPGMGLDTSPAVRVNYPEQRVFVVTVKVPMGRFDTASLHRMFWHNLPFGSLVTLTMTMEKTSHTSEQWKDILSPLTSVELLKVHGSSTIDLVRALVFTCSSDDGLPSINLMNYLIPNLTKLIISGSPISKRLLSSLCDVARGRRSVSTTVKIAFEDCTVYPSYIINPLVGIADVTWNGTVHKPEKGRGWLRFLRDGTLPSLFPSSEI